MTIGAGVLGGLALALVAWLLKPPTRPAPQAPDVHAYGQWVQGPCYRVEGARLRRVMPPARAAEPAVDFAVEKPAGTTRIAVVGESTGEMLERVMAALASSPACGGRLEILECSTFGAHPDFAVRRAEEVVQYSPDVLVVAIGHNFRNPRLVPTGPAALQDAAAAEVPARAREAMQQIASAASARGVRVLSLLLASNLEYPPRTDPEYVSSPARAAAWMRWASGDPAGAAQALEAPIAQEIPGRAYERARFRAEAGDWTGAKKDYVLARDLDVCLPDVLGGCAYRASSQTNAAIAEVTRAAGGATLDVDALLSALTPHGLIGWSTIWDHCHPLQGPLVKLASGVLHAAAPEVAGCVVETTPHPPEDGPEAILEGQAPGVRLDDADRLGWEVFADNAGWHRRVGWPMELLIQTMPDSALALVSRFDAGKLDALEARSHATVLAALGAAARDHGRLDIARWALDRARQVRPLAFGLVELALVQIRQGELAAGRASLEAALTVEPENKLARRLLDLMH